MRKKQCDDAFKIELKKTCDDALGGGDSAQVLADCNAWALLYWAGVDLHGEPAYQGNQIDACNICGIGAESTAKKFTVSFVKGYDQCDSGTFIHYPPFTSPACTPITQYLAGKFGAKGGGRASGKVFFNPLKQATDVILKYKLFDVRTSTGVPYNGNLFVNGTFRLTDANCIGSPNGGCTVADFPFPVIVPCGSTASPPLAAGKCAKNTTANEVIPGMIAPGMSMNVEFQQLQVYMGTALTFVQGLYLP